MSDDTQDERLKSFLEERRKKREAEDSGTTGTQEHSAGPAVEAPEDPQVTSPDTPEDGESERFATMADEAYTHALTEDAVDDVFKDLEFSPTSEEDEASDLGVVGPLYSGESIVDTLLTADDDTYQLDLSALSDEVEDFDDEDDDEPTLDDIIHQVKQDAVQREEERGKTQGVATVTSEELEAETLRKNEEAERIREAKLKSFIDKRRKDAAPDAPDPNDPYGGDAIAKKHLKHLQKYLDREDVEDIKEVVINRPEEVGIEHADGTWEWIKDPDLHLEQLEDIARMLANRSGQLFHPGNPILSVKMPGGHRVQVVAGFNAPSGFVFAMRLQRREKFSIDDFVMPEEQKKQVLELIKTKHTLLISGGTATGKTSFLNAIIPAIPMDERLVSMEDVSELRIPHRNWAPLLFAGNDTAQGDQGVMALLNACLRLRPDRIILGEIRKENAFAFCSAINTGHEGSVATIHANSPKMALDAVINRVLMNGDMPDSAIQVLRNQLVADIFAVVQLTRRGKKVHAELLILDEETAKRLAEDD